MAQSDLQLPILQVLEKALEVWDLQVIPLNCPVAEPAQIDPELENAFICHLHDHWFCIRKVNGEWYNFDSLYAAPEHLSKFYLSAYLDSLKSFGWSIFIVRGNFPKECPMSSESSYGYGQWLSPEDAERITKSCNTRDDPKRMKLTPQNTNPFIPTNEADRIAEMEEEELKAAIAASLLDTSPATAPTQPDTSATIPAVTASTSTEPKTTTAVSENAITTEKKTTEQEEKEAH